MPRFNAARGFVGGAASALATGRPIMNCFNAARGFVGGAARETIVSNCLTHGVSMPHAALWVVQPSCHSAGTFLLFCFNAARGFVGGAA